MEDDKVLVIENISINNNVAKKTYGTKVVDEVCADSECESRLADVPKAKPKQEK